MLSETHIQRALQLSAGNKAWQEPKSAWRKIQLLIPGHFYSTEEKATMLRPRSHIQKEEAVTPTNQSVCERELWEVDSHSHRDQKDPIEVDII
jgi:hypothetical protein